jgi:hypothetical protein
MNEMPKGCEVRITDFCVCHIIEDITTHQKLVHIRSRHRHEVQTWHVYTNANFNLEEYHNEVDAFLHHMLTNPGDGLTRTN